MNLSRLHAAWLLVVSAWLLVSAPAAAGTLDATITRTSGGPLRDVRVEVLGPDKQTLYSGEQGKVLLELPGGSYTLRIINQGQQMEFELRVPGEGKVSPSFELE